MPGKKAVFLDRDGTINFDPGYLRHPDQVQLLPTVGEALQKMERAGFELIVVSNQSGVGRGLFKAEMLPLIHARLNELLVPYQVQFKHFYLCLHRPEDDCACRKPKTLLLENARKDLDLDFSRSFMVGDKHSDLLLGRAAHLKGVALVRTGDGSRTESSMDTKDADFIGDSLLAVSDWILRSENVGS